MKHTPEQQKILDAEPGNILVSAAAGAGKTAVLTDRIVRRIVSGQLDIQQVLVMTFTEAAAREMKERIEKKLQLAWQAEPDSHRRQILSRQLSLLPGAAISTIHAFCLRVIRDFAYLLQDEHGEPLLDAGFAVDDGIEADLILQRSLSELMEQKYEQIDAWAEADRETADKTCSEDTRWIQAFYHLVDGFGSSRSDQPVHDLIIRQLNYLRSLPDYPAFIRRRLDELEQAASNFSVSRHAQALYRMLQLRLDRARMVQPRMQQLLDGDIRFIKDAERNHGYQEQFRQVFSVLGRLEQSLSAPQPDWDEICAVSSGLAELDIPRLSRNDQPEKRLFLSLFDQHVAELVHFLTGGCATEKYRKNFVFDTRPVFTLSAAEITRDLLDMLPVMRLFFSLVLELDRHYAANKRLAGLIDFSDFEHFALSLLRMPQVQTYYRTRFQEIYIDEYQDTSSIQEAILQSVSRENCLMVGDLKQSIYRFRHARPQIFKARAEACRQDRGGRLIELNRNFRSVPGILAGANGLFRQILSPGAGEITYDEHQALIPFRSGGQDGQPFVLKLLHLDESGEAETDDPDLAADRPAENSGYEPGLADQLSRHEQEALLAALQIRLLHDRGRPWKDMAILCRTGNLVQTCAAQLTALQIPVLEGHDAAAFDIPELHLAESLVQVLDNPRQDFHLAAVMRSGLLGQTFSDQDLATIRLYSYQQGQRQIYFHQAAASYRLNTSDSDLSERVRKFWQNLTDWRERAGDLRLDELLTLLFSQSHWPDQLALHPDGNKRIRILDQFIELARQFESRRRRGVSQFARYLEQLREKEALAEHFSSHLPAQDGVRLMTVHGSKGLEFPVVFLVGSRYRLSPRDSQEAILVSESLGIGLDYADPERQVRYPSHLKLAMLAEIKAAVLAEELRLFYVALTRAQDKLVIVASVSSREPRLTQLIRQARMIQGEQLPDHLVLSCQSYLEWLILALARCRDSSLDWLEEEDPLQDLPAMAGQELPCFCAISPVSWQSLTDQLQAWAGSLAEPESSSTTELESFVPDEKASLSKADEALKVRLLDSYRYEQATQTPVKWSVSELKRIEQLQERTDADQENAYDLRLAGWQPGSPLPELTERRGINLALQVSSLSSAAPADDPSAASLGTLLHTVFRYLDLPAVHRSRRPDRLAHHLQQMQALDILSEDEVRQLESWHEDILAFADSDLAAEIVEALQRADQSIYFEMPFTLAVPVSELKRQPSGFSAADQVLVQGMIDCWYKSGDSITLVDYKSDRLEGDDETCARLLAERYAGQLAWYTRAIEGTQKIAVKRRLIWHIQRRRVFDLS